MNRVEIEAFVPGVNSGIYEPATLNFNVRIKERAARFFQWRDRSLSGSILLSIHEFDDLLDQMTRIRNLREDQSKNESS